MLIMKKGCANSICLLKLSSFLTIVKANICFAIVCARHFAKDSVSYMYSLNQKLNKIIKYVNCIK